MKDIIDLAAEYNITSIHYMWLIVKGEAVKDEFLSPEIIFSELKDKTPVISHDASTNGLINVFKEWRKASGKE